MCLVTGDSTIANHKHLTCQLTQSRAAPEEVENDYTEIDGPDQSQQRVSHHSQWELSQLTEGN